MVSPKKQPPAPVPVPSSTPAPTAVDSKPVVEAADPTPTAPEAKVEPAPNTPIPALHTPEPPHPTPEPLFPTPEPTRQETLDIIECAEPLAQPELEPEAPNSESKSESITEIPTEKQQSSSEKTVPEQPESEPVDANQQTQGATAAEIPKVQQQIDCEEEVEKQPCSEAESSDVKQQEHSDSVANSLAGQQEESHSEKLLPTVESEPQNATSDKDLGSAEPEIEPKIEAVVFLTDDVKVDPCPDQMENSIELKQKLSPEISLQELPAELEPKPDKAATMEKEQTAAEVEGASSNQSLQIEESKSPAVRETQQDLENTTVTSMQVDVPAESDALEVPAPDVKGEVADVKEGSSEEKVAETTSIEGAVPPPADADEDKAGPADSEVKLQQEEAVKCDQCESSSAVLEISHPSSGPPTAPAEKLSVLQTVDTSMPEPTEQHGTTEHEMPIEKVPAASEVAQQEVHQRVPDVETSATMSADEERDAKKKTAEKEIIEESAVMEAAPENQSSNAVDEDKAGSDRATENAAEGLELDKEKALANGESKEKTADQKPPKAEEEEEEVNRVESGLKPSAEAEGFSHEKEKKESEKTKEFASAVAGAIPKDETQIPETVAEKAQSDISGEADRKEGAGKKEEQQTSAGGTLRAGDECDKSAATSEEKVSRRESTPSGQMASCVGSDEETRCLQETAPVPENADEKKKETTADPEKKDLEEQKELTTGRVEKVRKEESQPVNSPIQTPVLSLAESNAAFNAAATTTDTQVDVSPEMREGDGLSEAADENKSVPVTEVAVEVAELSPVPIASKQEKGPQEENKQSPQPSDGGGEVDEVTVVNSIVLSNHKVQALFHVIGIVSVCACVRVY